MTALGKLCERELMPFHKSAEELVAVVEEALRMVGAPPDVAAEVAAHLVDADAAGHPSHGVAQVVRYVTAVREGEIVPDARPVVLTDRGPAALVSGEWGFGHVATRFATDQAIERSQAHGLALVGLVRAHHNGRLGAFAERAASRDTVLICLSGGQGRGLPAAVPHGGREPMFQSNPVAIGFPGTDGPAMIADFATSVLAGARIQLLHGAGETLPPGTIVGSDGKPVTDPRMFLEGRAWHLPFGGHKGFALMLTAELLGSLLTGAWQESPGPEGGLFRQAGLVMLAVRVDLFADASEVRQAATDLATRVRSSETAEGVDRVRVPGDPETEARKLSSEKGIPVAEGLWAELERLAGRH